MFFLIKTCFSIDQWYVKIPFPSGHCCFPGFSSTQLESFAVSPSTCTSPGSDHLHLHSGSSSPLYWHHLQSLLERGEVHWDALSGACLRLPHSLVINHNHCYDAQDHHYDDDSPCHYHIRNMIWASDSSAAKDPEAASIYFRERCLVYCAVHQQKLMLG